MSLLHMCKFETAGLCRCWFFAGDINSRKSTTGFVFTLGGTAISWASNLQKIVNLSTTKAEYIAATEAGKEMIWLHGFLDELGKKQEMSILHSDSQSAIFLAKNLVFHSKSKHIQTKYHFIRYLVKDKLIILKKICGFKNLADMLTKGVTIENLKLCAALIGLLAWGQEDELQGWGIVFWRIAVDVGDWTSLQMGDLLGFVEPSFVWSSLTTRPDPNNVSWFLIGDFLRLSPWALRLRLRKSLIKNHITLFGSVGVIKPDQTKLGFTNPNKSPTWRLVQSPTSTTIPHNIFGPFCSPLWILCAGCRKCNFEIRVCCCHVSWEREKHCSSTLYFFFPW